ncbi:MAG: FUSC family membrane protein [Chitinophagaceae bacterium]
MDYLNSYKSFINSHYVSEGIRMTAGILLPAFLASYFNMLPVGLVFSIGALAVSGCDSAGPIHHRRIGMLTCNASIFLVSLAVGLTIHSPVMLGIVLITCCFFFSMLGVFGARAGSIGIASLLVMVLNIDHQRLGWDILWNSLYVLGGGIWYMLFSLALYSVRPYKLAQQALGDCIQSIADYFRTRASFYDKNAAYDTIYRNLLQQQIIVQEEQNLLSEMLFKTRDIVKESTTTGRILIMMYLDAADLFERVMTSYHDYTTLHRYFDETPILKRIYSLAMDLAHELNEIGIAVKSGKPSEGNHVLWEDLNNTREEFTQFRKTHLKPSNIEGFISLRRILDNIQDIADRLQTLHHYTTYDRKLAKGPSHLIDYKEFISHQDITPQVFFGNISFQSNIFRHSLRVAIAVLTGYMISIFFKIGHSYWILLTIVVILKPAYSLTKRRNADRLIGTLCGALIGVFLLYLVQNTTALLVMMIALMTTSFIFIRKHYFTAVLFMTPYIILFFHLLYPNSFKTVLADRIIDTGIGSVIAFISSIFLVPAWEHTTMSAYMTMMLEDNSKYFEVTARAFGETRSIVLNQHQVARKNALVALANLSDAFNRMLSEPKSKQLGIDKINQFVVLNHMLTSHIATLSYYLQSGSQPFRSKEFVVVSKDVLQYLTNAIALLLEQPVEKETIRHKEALRRLNEQANVLLNKRKNELESGEWETATKKSLSELKPVVDQFNFIYKIVVDIDKVVSSIVSRKE